MGEEKRRDPTANEKHNALSDSPAMSDKVPRHSDTISMV